MDDGARIEAFFDRYRRAFEAFDLPTLAGMMAYPAQFVTVGRGQASVVSDPDGYVDLVTPLLTLYRKVGVAEGVITNLSADIFAPSLACVTIDWNVRSKTGPLYDFRGVYTLTASGGDWRICAIAHDDLPTLLACQPKAC